MANHPNRKHRLYGHEYGPATVDADTSLGLLHQIESAIAHILDAQRMIGHGNDEVVKTYLRQAHEQAVVIERTMYRIRANAQIA